jgi:hypothetical protein
MAPQTKQLVVFAIDYISKCLSFCAYYFDFSRFCCTVSDRDVMTRSCCVFRSRHSRFWTQAITPQKVKIQGSQRYSGRGDRSHSVGAGCFLAKTLDAARPIHNLCSNSPWAINLRQSTSANHGIATRFRR